MKISDLKRDDYKQAGFTLVEILMVLAIFGILMVAVQTMFTTGMDLFNREKADLEVRQQLYFAVEGLLKNIRNTSGDKIELPRDSAEYTEIVVDQTRYYLEGDKFYSEVAGIRRRIAEKIDLLEFSVICEAKKGVYDYYDPQTLIFYDNDGNLEDYDPSIKGMVVAFTGNFAGEVGSIYRRIVDYDHGWFEIDRGFSFGVVPDSNHYAIGDIYQIRLQTFAGGSKEGCEVITGAKPRL